jgi:propanol-preferring alcohol dehydrogenase
MANPAEPGAEPSQELMRALRIWKLGEVLDLAAPVAMETIVIPRPGYRQILLRVHACGVCHTEIDEIEGRSPPPRLPMTPGHQVVGTVVEEGPGCFKHLTGQRVGVAWIHSACGHCEFCRSGRENLCPDFVACGRDVPGGYAEFMVADENYVHLIPDSISDAGATPLLCAGAVGFRALRLCQLENGQSLGLTGFGASGHLVLQMARHLLPDSDIHVFARSSAERDFALSLGARWAGDTRSAPPHLLNAIIDTTPAWLPVLCALEHLAPGGRLVINAIRKESGDQHQLQTLNYERQLWMEKSIQSVANVTRDDVAQCLRLAVEIPLRPEVSEYPLEQAGIALQELKQGQIRGAKVLMCCRNE